jgi:hypothetical protein
MATVSNSAYNQTMTYDFTAVTDDNLRIIFIVLKDLVHKADLANSRGPLSFNNTPKLVTKDEQMAILFRLEKDSLIDFSINGKLIFLTQYIGKSFGDYYDQVHTEFHKRKLTLYPESLVVDTPKKKTKPIPTLTLLPDPGILIIGKNNIEFNPKINAFKVLDFILVKNKSNISKEFKYSELAKSPMFGDISFPKHKKSWETYRNACRYVNDKILKETGIQEFLLFGSKNTARFSINPKVLETLGITETKLG